MMAHDFFADAFRRQKFQSCCRSSCSSSGRPCRAPRRPRRGFAVRESRRPAVLLVELGGDVARHFDVLFLVRARPAPRSSRKSRCPPPSTPDRQTGRAWARCLWHLVLVAVRAFKQAHRRDGGKQPRQLGHFRHVRLAEENASVSGRGRKREIQRHVQRVFRRSFASNSDVIE